ncbi:MAG TPA: LLM class flavin-dependent oxidoreductase [Thermomicrobiaceae bacterium]|nr:LLM class flavin-dependent oxidoreductase [Thermomicrobiaceae bacterium]
MLFGIFDIMQVLVETSSREAYARHLSDVALADRLGLDFYFTAERHFMPHYRTPSPSVWLGAVAARTRRIRLGALAYVLPLHNPVRLAEEVAMLDHLSNGRMEVGIGLGHRVEELLSMRIDPREREALMMEGLVLLVRAWRGERFDHPGQRYDFADIYVEPPLQRPFPPLWYAGNNPEAAAWAARNGLSLAVGFQPAERLAAPCAAYREALSAVEAADQQPAAARPPCRLALMRHLYLAESDERAYDEMARDLMRLGDLFAASPSQVAASEAPRRLSRSEAEQQVEQLLRDETVIGGGPERVAASIAASARQLGLDVFLANPYLTGVESRRVRRTLRLYAEQVRPRARELLTAA